MIIIAIIWGVIIGQLLGLGLMILSTPKRPNVFHTPYQEGLKLKMEELKDDNS
jgi:hypothetical protein